MHRPEQNDANHTYNSMYMNHLTFSTLLNALYQGSVGVLFKAVVDEEA